jgi:hypothetical protein
MSEQTLALPFDRSPLWPKAGLEKASEAHNCAGWRIGSPAMASPQTSCCYTYTIDAVKRESDLFAGRKMSNRSMKDGQSLDYKELLSQTTRRQFANTFSKP